MFLLPLILFVLIIIIIIITFLKLSFVHVVRVYFEKDRIVHIVPVWLNGRDCTSLLVQRQHTVFGKFRLAIGCELGSPSIKRKTHQSIIIAALYRTVVVCRLSLQMFSKHCRFKHNTVSVKTFVLHHLFKWIDNTS